MIYTSYKKIDDVGRIVVPKDIRSKLGIHLGETLKLDIKDDAIIISKAELTCVFCGNTEDLTDFMGKSVCADCIKKLGKG